MPTVIDCLTVWAAGYNSSVATVAKALAVAHQVNMTQFAGLTCLGQLIHVGRWIDLDTW